MERQILDGSTKDSACSSCECSVPTPPSEPAAGCECAATACGCGTECACGSDCSC